MLYAIQKRNLSEVANFLDVSGNYVEEQKKLMLGQLKARIANVSAGSTLCVDLLAQSDTELLAMIERDIFCVTTNKSAL